MNWTPEDFFFPSVKCGFSNTVSPSQRATGSKIPARDGTMRWRISLAQSTQGGLKRTQWKRA